MGAPIDWYDSEQSTRIGMIAEAQRMARRLRARPLPIIVMTCLITTAVTYKLATRRPIAEAEVVLALTEGSLSQKNSGIPVVELREFVEDVLLPNGKLLELVKKRDLYTLRHRLGDQYAIDELRSHFTIQIWKNTFLESDSSGNSARIGLSVFDEDPELAFDLARDLSRIVIETTREQRQVVTKRLTSQVAEMRDRLQIRYEELTREASEKEQAQIAARQRNDELVAQAIELELAVNWREQRKAAATLAEIASSRDTLAERITEAGLDMSVTVVAENRPIPPENRGFTIAMAATVTALGALLASAFLVGAFDSRVHDSDDVRRLEIAVLGHLPGFTGDHVGSLESRGAARARVPSFLRWRSQR